jgi:hypothetical protein
LDRIDKVLLILPLLPVADLSSTLFSLNFCGEEVGILARPVLQNYGPFGLVMLAISASMIFLVFMKVVMHIKKLFIREWKFKWMWYILAIQICWFFVLESVYVSTVVMNFLVPVAPLQTQTVTLRVILVCTYFVCISALTIPQIRRMPRN